MSTTIDQKVVEMKFDNKQFQAGIADTTKSLDKLKMGLDFSGATKGLSGLNDSMQNVDPNPLNKGVQTLQASFSALQVMGVTALANITNAAINAGIQVVKSLTIDPIKMGFQEYETQINSVQTILANTQKENTTLNQVNRALDELNLYADKTIYNFTEMTRNIGTFTAAGVKLDDSVSAIKGIANLAALSGSNAQQASGAMYQLSQALAAGRVTLMDWNSVVNAGMGGKVFQDALMQTAETMGIAVDRSVSFRESISAANGNETWLTDDVLINTLQQFTGDLTEADLAAQGFTESQIEAIMKQAEVANDAATKVKTLTQLMDTLKEAAQSGWSQTWRTVVGDFEEARILYTEISNIIGGVIGASSDARNKVLSDGLNSSWDKFLDLGVIDEDAYVARIKTVAKEQGVAIDDMIENGESFRTSIKKLTNDGVLNSELLETSLQKLTDEYSNYSAEELKSMDITTEQVEAMQKLNEEVQNGTISMEEYVSMMNKNSGRDNLIDSLLNIFKAIGSIVTPIKEAFSDVFNPVTGDHIFKITEGIRKFTEHLSLTKGESKDLRNTFKGLFSIVGLVVDIFTNLAGIFIPIGTGGRNLVTVILDITGAIGEFIYKATETLKSSKIYTTVFETLSSLLINIGTVISGAIGSLLDIGDAADTFKEKFTSAMDDINLSLDGNNILDVLSGLVSGIETILSGLIGMFSHLGSDLINALSDSEFTGTALDAVNTGIFATIGLAIKNFLKGNTISLESITEILDGVKGSLEAFQNSLNAKTLQILATAIAILAASLWLIASIDSKKLLTATSAIAALFTQLLIAMKIFAGMTGLSKQAIASASVFIIMASAVLILSLAMRSIGSLSWKELAVGIAGLAASVTALMVMFKMMSATKGAVMKGATQLVIASVAVVILAEALKKMSDLSFKELATAVLGLAGVVKALSLIFSILSKNGKIYLTGSTQMVVASVAVTILASAVKKMSDISIKEMGVSMLGLAGIIITLTGMFNILAKNGAIYLTGAAQMVIASLAIKILTDTLGDIGKLSWSELGKGFAAIAGSLIILAIGLTAMSGTMLGTIALAASVAAINLLTPALIALSSLSWKSVLTSLGILAGSFITLGLAGYFLTPLIPSILALSGALVLLGISVAAIGIGIAGLGIGFTGLAIALGAVSAAGVGAAKALVTVVEIALVGLVSLIPTLATALVDGIYSFMETLASRAKSLADVLISILYETLPTLVKALVMIITTSLEALAEYTPRIAAALLKFVLGLIRALGDYLPEISTAVFELFGKLWESIAEMMSMIKPADFLKSVLGMGLLVAFLVILGSLSSLLPAAMKGILALGILVLELGLVLAIIGGIAQIPGLVWLVEEGGKFLGAVGSAIGQLIGGLIGGIGKGITSQLPGMASDLSSFMINLKPFLEGAQMLNPSSMKAIASLSIAILALTAAEVISGLTSWFTGGSSLTKFGEDLAAVGPNIKKFADSMVGVDGNALQASSRAILTLAQMAQEIPNEGGILATIVGENSLSGFVDELAKVGPKLKLYSDSVAGVNSQAIENSAVGIKALATMAQELPNEGGFVSVFTGENSLSDFADHLAVLGPKLKTYSDSVVGIDVNAITNSAKGIEEIVKIANDLPNEGGFVSVFTGENSLSQFATQLTVFGTQIKTYSTTVSGIDVAAMSAVTVELTNIVNMLNNLASTVTNASSFATSLISIGTNGITSLITGFTNSSATATSSITSTIETILDSALLNIASKNTEFVTAGNTLMTKLKNGITKGASTAKTAMSSAITTIVASVKTTTNYNKFYNAGKWFVTGFSNGITANTFKAKAAASAMASAAATSAEKELEVKSPSRVAHRIGGFFGIGFVNAIIEYGSKAADAGKNLANKAKTSLETAMENVNYIANEGLNPSIKPVLDLSDIENGVSQMDNMLSQNRAVTISNDMNSNKNGGNNPSNSSDGNTTTVNYTQNNYSPKSLTRYEIYRQTKNQLDNIKGV